jgi:hypothetical protein
VTLVERCADLQARIAWSSELHTRRARAEAIGDRTLRVNSVRPKVTFAVDRANAIHEHGLPWALPPSHAATVACRDASATVRAAAAGGKPVDLDDGTWRRVTAAIDEEATALELAVRTAIDAAQKPVHDLEFAGFEAVAVAFGKGAQVTQLKMTRQSLLNESWYGKPASELRRLLALTSDLLKAANELQNTDAPENVRRFLDSARRGEATIKDLTADVRSWLEEKGLLGQLRITLGAR